MTHVDHYGEHEQLDVHHDEAAITLGLLADVLRRYATVIVLTVTAVAVGYLLFAVAYLLIEDKQTLTTVGFRLEFSGAEQGQYPNGVRFSGSEIVDTPILRQVYDANELARFMSFADFGRSIVVLETNAALVQLAREYEARLADPKLSPIERQQIQTEYAQRRDSLSKSDYSLILMRTEGLKRIPPSVASKTLIDTLKTWSNFAATTRQVLQHRVPIVSHTAVTRIAAGDPDLLSSLMALRYTAQELQENAADLEKLPGAELVRSQESQASLRELRLELTQIERGFEYVLGEALSSGVIDRRHAAAVIESQLGFHRRSLQAAEERVGVLRAALEDYALSRGDRSAMTTEAGSRNVPPERAAGGESVVSQVSDTFLERIVTLAQSAADRDYRQRKVDEIRVAALESVPLRSAVRYAETLLARIREGGTPMLTPHQVIAERDRLAQRLSNVASELIAIRGILSRSLTTGTQIYSITSPPATMVERTVNVRRLALGGIFIVMAAAVIAVLGAFVHYRIRSQLQPASR